VTHYGIIESESPPRATSADVQAVPARLAQASRPRRHVHRVRIDLSCAAAAATVPAALRMMVVMRSALTAHSTDWFRAVHVHHRIWLMFPISEIT